MNIVTYKNLQRMFFFSVKYKILYCDYIDLMLLKTSCNLFELLSKQLLLTCIYNKIYSNPINVFDLGLEAVRLKGGAPHYFAEPQAHMVIIKSVLHLYNKLS